MTTTRGPQEPCVGSPTARRIPCYDPELAPLAAQGSVDGHSLRAEDIPRLRALTDHWRPRPETLRRSGRVWPEERTVPGREGHPDVPVVLLWPTTPYTGPRPALLACHGGGMVTGTAYSGTPALALWVEELGVVVFSVGYRLAPEYRHPAAVEDVMTVWSWMHAHAEDLGLDPARSGVFGVSAGACLAASFSLQARDLRLPSPRYQILQDAMLDDRHHRPSTFEHMDSGVWDRISSCTAWESYLGPAVAREEVSFYAAPGRAADHPEVLRGLPSTFLDVGTEDLFRDDVLAFGAALVGAGVPTEMHLWAGGWHGFSEMAPHVRLAQDANEARRRFLARRLAEGSGDV
ncbi:Acetyl esterase/lipase [Austwickia chelonae]|uniref:Alpha/beta hydrolase fold-3 domain-containing protein n=1 Tax=Austwickia chelonae NBRC 105200 TaxID=1184607 RepID=K6W5Y1_9MICO|nr:alpha/beta hydrolase [Austwickia chelonae]GAB77232.1 hypothetical protein AUCHE_05_01370 [Austwickia chelonae NBRC 105200]SEW05713.1 Acetyl esterase/lipase [Austwickia chelonae]